MTAGQKDELLSLLLKEAGIALISPPTEPALAVQREKSALSFSQQRVWFLSRLERGSAAYNVPIRLELSGAVRHERLQAALNALARRHDVLRSCFPECNGQPVQQPMPGFSLPLLLHDLSAVPENERAARAEELTLTVARASFNLETGPVIRAALLRLRPERWRLLVCMHHIATDDWSMRVFTRELLQHYRSDERSDGRLPPPPCQYSDLAAWQARTVSGKRLRELLAYWRPRVEGIDADSGLLPDRRRASPRSTRGASCFVPLALGLTERIHDFSAAAGCTSYMTLLAALKVFACAWTGREEAVIGTPVAGRRHPDSENVIGFFVNTLVLRTALDREMSFSAVLARVRETALDAFAHAEMPFEMLVRNLNLERDPSSTPLFQIFFNMLPPEQALDTAGLGFCIEEIDYCDTGASKFELTLYVRERNGRTWLQAVYNADVFEAPGIERLLRQYPEFIEAAMARPANSIGTLLSSLNGAAAAVREFNTPWRA